MVSSECVSPVDDRVLWEAIRIHSLKVAFDKAFALIVLFLLAPLLGLIALAIKLDGWLHPENVGPIFYREARMSQGRVFNLYKFRVLKVAAIEEARREKGHDHAKLLEGKPTNMTRFGRWLQKWYLDEIPQLFNVLRGELSVVGPRPWPVTMCEQELAQGVARKQLLRPGLTGLVQAHKDELSARGGDRALDEQYIEACRKLNPWQLLFCDLCIIAKTMRILAKGEGL
jgi:lipopolysaccharide/colanic/teichoic acid biosynthesis glycosyltransferase